MDGRKPASNSFVEALQARVTALESVENENKVLRRQLDRYKSGQPYREFSASPPPDPSPAEGAAASPNESLTEMVEGLKVSIGSLACNRCADRGIRRLTTTAASCDSEFHK